MRDYKRFGMGILFVVAACAVFVFFANGALGACVPAEAPRHVVSGNEIQGQIDQQINQVDADRQEIQRLLQNAEFRRLAGAAGLDLTRASAATDLLSGTSLETMASQARAVNSELAGGERSVVVSTTAIIIGLLVLILLVG